MSGITGTMTPIEKFGAYTGMAAVYIVDSFGLGASYGRTAAMYEVAAYMSGSATVLSAAATMALAKKGLMAAWGESSAMEYFLPVILVNFSLAATIFSGAFTREAYKASLEARRQFELTSSGAKPVSALTPSQISLVVDKAQKNAKPPVELLVEKKLMQPRQPTNYLRA